MDSNYFLTNKRFEKYHSDLEIRRVVTTDLHCGLCPRKKKNYSSSLSYYILPIPCTALTP